ARLERRRRPRDHGALPGADRPATLAVVAAPCRADRQAPRAAPGAVREPGREPAHLPRSAAAESRPARDRRTSDRPDAQAPAERRRHPRRVPERARHDRRALPRAPGPAREPRPPGRPLVRIAVSVAQTCDVTAVLVTGMSGTGKSSALAEPARRGDRGGGNRD